MRWKSIAGMMLLSPGLLLQAANVSEPCAKRLNYKIVLPEGQTEIQKTAAEELAKFLEKIYDQPIVFNGSDEPLTFFVGVGLDAVMAGFTDIPDMAKDEAFGVFAHERGILLHGYDDATAPFEAIGRAGTLHAVYYLLTREMGVDFFFQGEAGMALTKNTPLALKQGNAVPVPSFSMRGFSFDTKEFTGAENRAFYHRMLCSQPRRQNAKSYYFEDWEKRFFETKPEYFAEVDGRRVFHHYHNGNMCYMNPAVVRQAAGDIIEIFNKNPGIKTVRFLSDNNYSPCLCKKCSAAEVRRISNAQEHYSEEYFAFVQRVAEIVFRVHPDCFFICNTKPNLYDRPPATVKLDRRVIIDYLTRRSDPNAYPDLLKAQIALIDEWRKNGNPIYVKDYNRYPHFKDYPLMTHHYTARYLGLLKGHVLGVIRSDMSPNAPFVFSALNNYVQGRLLFDLSEDVDGIVRRFVSYCYPGAETEMIAFYNGMERIWASNSNFSGDPLQTIYCPENLSDPRRLLKEARKKLAGKSVLLDKMEPAFEEFCRQSENADPAGRREYNARKKLLEKPMLVKRARGAIAIDGEIGADEWAGAGEYQFQPALDMRDLQKGDPFQTSSVRIMHDGKALYIALTADETKMDRLSVVCGTNGKGAIWGDDSFEVMLVPSEAKYPYYQIIVNASGFYRVFHYQPGGKRDDKLEIVETAKVKRGENGYSIELKVPLHHFPEGTSPNQWKFNAFRNRVIDGTAANRQSSGLSILGNNFHQHDAYFTLQWEK
ncbi:MAG: DUF4838 domain-containing protein [Verrucomicrobiota bacterium]